MADGYLELLDATIQHLLELKAQGSRWVNIDATALNQLAASPALPKSSTRITNRPTLATAAAHVPGVSPSFPARSAPAPAVIREAAPVPVESSAYSPAPAAISEAADPIDKLEAIAKLRERTLSCNKCVHLASSRKTVVFGVGDVESPLMFVGEAPGADEDIQGEPFVGAAGQLLTRIIKAMGYTRETVYIANVLKCRPDTPGQTHGNRKPTPDEMQTCLPYLLEQIRIIRPRVIVALGATAMEGLFGRAVGISKARGNWHDFRSTPVMPTFHPSYLLRNQAPAVKRQVWEDMLQVLERLGAVISDKQRNYFKA